MLVGDLNWLVRAGKHSDVYVGSLKSTGFKGLCLDKRRHDYKTPDPVCFVCYYSIGSLAYFRSLTSCTMELSATESLHIHTLLYQYLHFIPALAIVLYVVYQRVFSPLASFPGPF